VTADGEAFDGVMRDIVGNHVAIVWQARGGPGLRVADRKPKQEKRVMRTVTIDGTAVNFEDDTQGAMVELALKRAADAIKVATDASTAATARAVTAETALTEQGKAMKDLAAAHAVALDAANALVLKPEQVSALVVETASVIADAKKVDKDFVTDGKSAAEVRVGILDGIVAAKDGASKTLVTKLLGGVEPSKANPVLVGAAFDAIVALSGRSSAQDTEGARAFAPAAVTGARGGTARVIDFNARRAPAVDKAQA
jgi:hypothetical protein